MKTILVIPTYNEAENLPKLAASIFALPLKELSILIVDDNSQDGTGEIAEKLNLEYKGRVHVMHRAGKLGLGTAYIQGFRKALELGAEAIGQMDADFSHPVEKVPELIKKLERCDMVLGSRYVTGGSLDESWPFWRKALSGFGNFYARTILGMKLLDVTGGYRLWRKATLEGMPLDRIRSNGYVFQVEMAYVASRLGYKFMEIPIHFMERRKGQSKMSFRIQIEAALRVWQLPGLYRDLPKA
ncbi:MAG: polyprenol monophosphomannose synthase [Anaerolineaceae bacterium]